MKFWNKFCGTSEPRITFGCCCKASEHADYLSNGLAATSSHFLLSIDNDRDTERERGREGEREREGEWCV